MGGTMSDLIPLSTNFSATNCSDLCMLGAATADLKVGEKKTKQMIYIYSGVYTYLYLNSIT